MRDYVFTSESVAEGHPDKVADQNLRRHLGRAVAPGRRRPEVEAWTLMVQREIADRLRARPWTRAYGSPSVVVQLACEVRMLRKVDRAVFTPRPRVDSALLGLRRTGPAPPQRSPAGP